MQEESPGEKGRCACKEWWIIPPAAAGQLRGRSDHCAPGQAVKRVVQPALLAATAQAAAAACSHSRSQARVTCRTTKRSRILQRCPVNPAACADVRCR